MVSHSPNPNLTPLATIGKLDAGSITRADLDAATKRHDAGAYLLAAAALTGADRWTLDPAALGEAVHAHPRTLARAAAALVAAGLWRDEGRRVYSRGPNLPEPSGAWVVVSPALAARLGTLGATRLGLTALRVALWALPRIRAARAAGRSAAIVTNARLADELGLGRSQAARAFVTLGALGLRSIERKALLSTEEGWRREPRALATDAIPWSHDPAAARHDKPGRAKGQNGAATVPVGTEPKNGNASHTREAQEGEKGAPGGASVGCVDLGDEPEAPAEGREPPGLDRGTSGPATYPASAPLAAAGVTGANLARLAAACFSTERAEAFIAGEAPMLAWAANPGAWLVAAWRDYGARPGSPSQAARRRALEMDAAKKADAWHGRAGLENPDGRAPLPEPARAWYEARATAEEIRRLDRREGRAAYPGERAMLRAVLAGCLATLDAAGLDLPDLHAHDLPAWAALAASADPAPGPSAAEEAAALDAELERRAAEARADREAEEAARRAARQAAAAARGEGVSGRGASPKGGGHGAGGNREAPAVTGAAIALGDRPATCEDLRRMGNGNAAAGLRLWLSGRRPSR